MNFALVYNKIKYLFISYFKIYYMVNSIFSTEVICGFLKVVKFHFILILFVILVVETHNPAPEIL